MDTSVAIDLRDRVPATLARFGTLAALPAISLITLAELVGGVYRPGDDHGQRSVSLDAMLAEVEVLPVNEQTIAVYGGIVAALGYSRRQVFDRLIAATAIVHQRTLITANPRDFRDIPDLKLEIWPAPQ